MANQFGIFYKAVKSAFLEISKYDSTNIAFTENADTLTLSLTVKDAEDELQFIYIWGNNPLSVIFKDDLKIITSSAENLVDKIMFIIGQWKKRKTI